MKLFEMFCEPNGKVSFTRVSGFLLLIAYIIVFLYISIKTLKIQSMPESLGLFIGGLYGINKLLGGKNEIVR